MLVEGENIEVEVTLVVYSFRSSGGEVVRKIWGKEGEKIEVVLYNRLDRVERRLVEMGYCFKFEL